MSPSDLANISHYNTLEGIVSSFVFLHHMGPIIDYERDRISSPSRMLLVPSLCLQKSKLCSVIVEDLFSATKQSKIDCLLDFHKLDSIFIEKVWENKTTNCNKFFLFSGCGSSNFPL